jgi:hypothetical protein
MQQVIIYKFPMQQVISVNTNQSTIAQFDLDVHWTHVCSSAHDLQLISRFIE